jgi:hypothetical protein
MMRAWLRWLSSAVGDGDVVFTDIEGGLNLVMLCPKR